jgi:hypothetical protein
MDSKMHVNSLIVSDDVHDRVLFDANIGELISLTFEDEGVLKIKGAYGIVRVDLTLEELEAMLSQIRMNIASK